MAINGKGFNSWPLEPDPAATLGRMIEAYEGGAPQYIVARQFQCSISTAASILRAAGCTRHRGGNAGR